MFTTQYRKMNERDIYNFIRSEDWYIVLYFGFFFIVLYVAPILHSSPPSYYFGKHLNLEHYFFVPKWVRKLSALIWVDLSLLYAISRREKHWYVFNHQLSPDIRKITVS